MANSKRAFTIQVWNDAYEAWRVDAVCQFPTLEEAVASANGRLFRVMDKAGEIVARG